MVRQALAGVLAAHGDDLEAATQVGLRPVFVHRPHEWGPGGGDAPPGGLADLVSGRDLEDVAGLLGC